MKEVFSKLDDGFQWIESYTNLEKKADEVKRFYRLDRMFRLLELFQNPQSSFKSIHLAGSKGKGSTAVLLASGLQEMGLKTGLYTSPHLLCYQERIRVNLSLLDDTVYLDQINRIYNVLLSGTGIDLPGGNDPTTFELLTLLAFLVFEAQGCQWAVIETGLGGRLDATNTLNPKLCVITPIEKEHTAWLGNSLSDIAAEKAGIIKPDTPLVIAFQQDESLKVIYKTARERNSAFLYVPDCYDIQDVVLRRIGTEGILLKKADGQKIPVNLDMLGAIQLNNAAAALTSLEILFPKGNPEIWVKGFSHACLPGRMQVLSDNPLIIADGAHTPRSLKMAIQDFLQLQSGDKGTLLFACGDDKNAEDMAVLACRFFRQIVITTPGYFKKSHPEKVRKIFEKMHDNVNYIEDPVEAFRTLIRNDPDTPVLIAGSFFLAGAIIGLYKEG